jgi:hypothetical protein
MARARQALADGTARATLEQLVALSREDAAAGAGR